MFIKLYKYHVLEEKECEYLKIQEQAESIYSKYVNKHTVHLKSKTDKTKWVEIHWYKDEENYYKGMKVINEQEEIQMLYKQFSDVIVSKEELLEEDFEQILGTGINPL